MANFFSSARNRLRRNSALRFWTATLANTDTMPKGRLRSLRKDASKLARILTRFENSAQKRLEDGHMQSLPIGVDWAVGIDFFAKAITPRGHVPLKNGTKLSETVTAFSDDPEAQIGLRQTKKKNGRYSIVVDIYRLGGSFLSFAIGLGESVAKSLGKGDLLRVSLSMDIENDVEVLVRLNLRSGPNTEQVIRQFQPGSDVEFDLFYVEFEPERMSDAWIDLMLPPHAMNRIEIHDIVISRLPRAEI